MFALLTVQAYVVSVVFKETVPGWASVVTPVYLIYGVRFLRLGVTGEYVGTHTSGPIVALAST